MQYLRVMRLLTLAAMIPLAGCELTEVTAAGGEDVLVVEAVLRAGEPVQRVLLHRTLEGRTVEGEPGARVVVRTPTGREIRFEENPIQACVDGGRPDALEIVATCYVSPRGAAGFVVPGGTYELRIETTGGEVLRGRTEVPGAFELLSPNFTDPPADRVCSLPPGTMLPLVWSASEGAWVYVTEVEITGLRGALVGRGIDSIPDPLELTGLSISEQDTTLILPGEVGIFERASYDQELLRALQNGFPAGVGVQVTVAAADRNYVNAVRGGAFNPSGNVRISSVVGDGVGVFGSVVPRRFRVWVAEDVSESPCLAR